MKRFRAVQFSFLVVTAALILSLVPLASAQSTGVPPANFGSITYSKPHTARLSTVLDQLDRGINRGETAQLQGMQNLGLEVQNNRVKVMIVAQDDPSAIAIIGALESMTAQVTAYWDTWIDAWIPVSALESVAALPGVIIVQQPIPVLAPADPNSSFSTFSTPPGSGTFVTQGVHAANADAWQDAGYRGAGVHIAILDSFQNYTGAQAVHELPPNLTIAGSLDTSSPHGTAVTEIIHDMAPDAALTLASPTSVTDMANKIVNLAASGNKIISSSIGYFNYEPGDGTGPMSNAINTAYGTYGAVYVQAAGNQATFHWDGQFVSTDGDAFHEFATVPQINEVDDFLGQLPVGFNVRAYLRWNSWPLTHEDYDFHLAFYDTTQSKWILVASSTNDQAGASGAGLPPTEFINYTVPSGKAGYYGLAVERFSTTSDHILDITVASTPPFHYNVAARSLVDPATPNGAFAVAALDVHSPFTLEDYSSRGPAHGTGGSLAAGNNQPRISGFANVDTWTYGLGAFNGTSAATPHVSGAAALLWQANPGFNASTLRTTLEGRAVDMGAGGYDTTYGAGRLNLGSPPALPPASTNLLRNGGFDEGTFYWSTFGNITSQVSGGVLQMYGTPGSPRGVAFQSTLIHLPANLPIEVDIQLGNNSAVLKRAAVLIGDSDFSDLQFCSFWLPPNTPLHNYTIQTFTTKAWTNATLSVYTASADSTGYYLVDNASLKYLPALPTTSTKCIDPLAPSPPGGADSANLIQNGDFASDMAHWSTFGQIHYQLASNTFEFYGSPGTPGAVVFQYTSTVLVNNKILEAQVDLGNTSAIRKRVVLMLGDSDFSDLEACSFWIPPSTPLHTYVMRSFVRAQWDNATFSVYASADSTQWTQVDNASLKVRPSVSIVGTECYYPGATLPIPPLAADNPLGLPIATLPPPMLSIDAGQSTTTNPDTPSHTTDQGTTPPSLDAPPPGSG